MAKVKDYRFLTGAIIIIVILVFLFGFTGAGEVISNGNKYDCKIKVNLDVIGSSDIKSASCSYAGESCFYSPGGLYSWWNPLAKASTIYFSNGETTHSKDISQSIVGSKTWSKTGMCFPRETDEIKVSLIDDDGKVHDSTTVSVTGG